MTRDLYKEAKEENMTINEYCEFLESAYSNIEKTHSKKELLENTKKEIKENGYLVLAILLENGQYTIYYKI